MTIIQEKQINNLIEKMNLEFEYEIIPVLIEPYSISKQCYSNVEYKVKKDGGKIHYGWSVHFNKGIIIEAERHAVWENDNEDLVCITPHPGGLTEVVFLSDNTKVDKELQIDNVRMSITNNILVNDWIYLCDTIGLIYYKYTDRLNNDEVSVETPVLMVIKQLEEWKGLLMGLINMNKKERSTCFCEKGIYDKRKYLSCHSKIFKKEVPILLDSISSFIKR